MKRQFIFLLLVFVTAVKVNAQHSQHAYQVLADSLFKYHNYVSAAQYYERAIKNSSDSSAVMLQVAKSYAKANQFKKAEEWYDKALSKGAAFTEEDTFYYIRQLVQMGHKKEAEHELQKYLNREPAAEVARSLLLNIRNSPQYLTDSSQVTVKPMLNTEDPEFAPVYYKDGLIFTASRSRLLSHKKYYWDDSFYLNLYYSPFAPDGSLNTPELLNRHLVTDMHDGPASVYADGTKMIINRNSQSKIKGLNDIFISNLKLFEVDLSGDAKNLKIEPLALNNYSYSFAHPNISEEGNVLYFVSDMPGGYGGTDIYVSRRYKGIWSEPMNLGPTVNTPGNEVFPYYVDNTLYFGSDGHGGLGGLDIFKSKWGMAGFDQPENLGYPINSNKDDFAFITKDHKSGYFSSTRAGNDDIFRFDRSSQEINMGAQVMSAASGVSLPGAEVEVITTDDNIQLKADEDGTVLFELPDQTAYILIAKKDGKTGIISGIASTVEDVEHIIHPVQAFDDEESVLCLGNIANEKGLPRELSDIEIIDVTTGKKVPGEIAGSLVKFEGVKGHQYKIQAVTPGKAVVSTTLTLSSEEEDVKNWEWVVKEQPAFVMLRGYIIDKSSGKLLNNMNVDAMNPLGVDQNDITNESGEVNFLIPVGAPYMLVASNGDLVGMEYGFIADNPDFISVEGDTVYVSAEQRAGAPRILMIRDSEGRAIETAKITLINEETGEKVELKNQYGLSSFLGEMNGDYKVQVEAEGYELLEREVKINDNQKQYIALTLRNEATDDELVTIEVIKEDDNSLVPNANLELVRFSGSERLLSDENGMVYFEVPQGEAYIISGEKDGWKGEYAGIAENKVLQQLILSKNPPVNTNLLQVVTDQNGKVIPNATAQILDLTNNEQIDGTIENGLLTFPVEEGHEYKLIVSADNYLPQEATAKSDFPLNRDLSELPTIQLVKQVPVAVKVDNEEGTPIDPASLKVKERETGKEVKADFVNNELKFLGAQGKQYDVFVEQEEYLPVKEKVIIPAKADKVAPAYIRLQHLGGETPILAQADSSTQQQAPDMATASTLDNAQVEEQSNKMKYVKLPLEAVIMFIANQDPAGLQADLFDQYTKDESEQLVDASVELKGMGDQILDGVDIYAVNEETGERTKAELKNGILSFKAKPGNSYKIEGQIPGYQPIGESLAVDENGEIHPSSIQLESSELEEVIITAHLMIDGQDVEGAEVQLLNSISGDATLVSDANGKVSLKMAPGSAYMIMVTKDGYSTMYTGLSDADAGKELTLELEKTPSGKVPVYTKVETAEGTTLADGEVELADANGETIRGTIKDGYLTFYGKPGSSYNLTKGLPGYKPVTTALAVEEKGTTQPTSIQLESSELEEVIITAHLMIDGKDVEGAEVQLLNSISGDATLVSDANGKVSLKMAPGSAYMIMVTKDGYSTMYTGLSDADAGKELTLELEKTPSGKVPVYTKVETAEGTTLADGEVELADANGETIRGTIKDGYLTFYGKPGSSYNLTKGLPGYKPVTTALAVEEKGTTQPTSIQLESSELEEVIITAHLMIDGKDVEGAEVQLLNSISGDATLVSDANGKVSLKMAPGSAYMIMVTKDGYSTMYTGLSDADAGKELTLELEKTPSGKVPVYTKVETAEGTTLADGEVELADANGETIRGTIKDGYLTFYGKPGSSYNLTKGLPGYKPVTTALAVEEKGTTQPTSIQLESSELEEVIITAHLMIDGKDVEGAEVQLLNSISGDATLVSDANGKVSLKMAPGSAYMIMVTKDGYSTMYTGLSDADAGKELTLELEKTPSGKVPVYTKVETAEGTTLTDGEVELADANGETIRGAIKNGYLTFYGKPGSSYNLAKGLPCYKPVTTALAVEEKGTTQPTSIQLESSELEEVIITAHLMIDGQDVEGAEVQLLNSISGDATLVSDANGKVSLKMAPGSAYMIMVTKDGYSTMYTGLSDADAGKELTLELEKTPSGKVPVYTKVETAEGTTLADGEVELADANGETIRGMIKDGYLTFYGKPGSSYNLTKGLPGYKPVTTALAVEEKGTTQPTSIQLESSELEEVIITAHLMIDGKDVEGAEVQLLNSISGDATLVSDANGKVSLKMAPGSAYMIMVTKGGYSTMYTGLSDADAGKELTLELEKTPSGKVPVYTKVETAEGTTLTDGEVELADANGETIRGTIKDGYLTFYGKPGSSYNLTKGLPGYKPVTTALAVEEKGTTQPTSIQLESSELEEVIITAHLMIDGKDADDSEVQVLNFASGDSHLRSNSEGKAEIKMAAGTAYLIMTTKGDYSGMYTGLSDEDNGKEISIAMIKNPKGRVPVTAIVRHEGGDEVPEGEVIITDMESGEQVTGVLDRGFLSFYGLPGSKYKVEVITEKYAKESAFIEIDRKTKKANPLELILRSNIGDRKSIVAHTFTLSDSVAVAEASVKVLSFLVDDMTLMTDKNGIVTFEIPEGSAYMAIASKGELSGVYSGVSGDAEKVEIGMEPYGEDQIPVALIVLDDNRKPLEKGQLIITDTTSAERVVRSIENGLLSFKGQKGSVYKLEIRSDDFAVQQEHISVSRDAFGPQAVEVSLTRKRLLALNQDSKLVIVDNSNPKAYIINQESHEEIVEEDGQLYIQNEAGKRLLGKGTIQMLMDDPATLIEMEKYQGLTLGNIYFDFDSYALDDEDTKQLQKLANLMKEYPALNVLIATHADIRGSASYNMKLTLKRAKAIETYLGKLSMSQKRIDAKSYGKSAPVVVCPTGGCNEQQHKLNRRGEFHLFVAAEKVEEMEPLTIKKPQPVKTQPSAKVRVASSYEELLQKYGEVKKEGVVFKVAVGAYRRNDDLTFDQLKDLGEVERTLVNEMNYYYLTPYETFGKSEEVRQQVIDRGVKDAYIAVFYNGEKITFPEFIALMEE
ncbi:OmpA family protein [Fulvivirga maritima]|uniref:OmpA family protein n=1 Tax=Fulvivirga maritima TaxID=2904247 RepID=UPI001F38413B|nr:OmpA family protein [Fulvivirga maritima]UII27404.1 OmpA family protein [Fulvivirga maritima]